MANIVSGLHSNELVENKVTTVEQQVNKLESNLTHEQTNYLGSVKIVMQSNTGTFKIKQSLGGERVVMMFLMVNQDVPMGTVLGVYKNSEVILQSNSLIKSITPTQNGDGTITFEVMVFESGMWSRCACILPKDYII